MQKNLKMSQTESQQNTPTMPTVSGDSRI